jgi:hypothetical protein
MKNCLRQMMKRKEMNEVVKDMVYMKNCLRQMTPLLKRKEMNEVVKVGYQILCLQEWGCDLDLWGLGANQCLQVAL